MLNLFVIALYLGEGGSLIKQEVFFEGLEYEECVMKYSFGEIKCYKGKDGGFYRIDHFDKFYVIEYAENEKDAQNNNFEDGDLFDATLPEIQLIGMIRNELIKYMEESDIRGCLL